MSTRTNLLKASRHVSELAHEPQAELAFKPISADSHVTEPPDCYIAHIDPQFRDQAPRVVTNAAGGEMYVIEGMAGGKPYTVGYGGMSAAGRDPQEIDVAGVTFEQAHAGGWDGKARVAAQDADGIGGEVIYPSVGMAICNHPDARFKHACFQAYNRWLAEFQAAAPDRIFGLGQTAVLSVEQTVADLRAIKDMGFCGAMFPCEPSGEVEYDDPRFDAVWEAAVGLDLPIAFHILTSRTGTRVRPDSPDAKGRGMAFFHHTLIRANQDVLSQFVWGRVFERFPALRVVCAEADAGWVPHFMYRLDHFYHRHRFHQKVPDMDRLPSEQIAGNVWFTFQDDFVALSSLDLLEPRRLLWANDFPHSDSTWPWSRQLLAAHTAHLPDEERRWILRDNAIAAFNLPV